MPFAEDPRADQDILERIVRRDASAMADLYDRHARLLFSLIFRILKDRAETEEVLQEVFVQVWTRADSYNAVLGSVPGWLVGVARNRAIDRLRANAVRARAADAAPPSDPARQPSPETQAVMTERQRAVLGALATLPPDQRQLIECAYYEGCTQSELAARFKIPLGTVKTRIRAGMTALRRELDRSTGRLEVRSST